MLNSSMSPIRVTSRSMSRPRSRVVMSGRMRLLSPGSLGEESIAWLAAKLS